MLVPGTISGQLPGRYLAFGKTISLRDDILTCGQDDIRLVPDDIQAVGLNDIREPGLADLIRRAISARLGRRGGG